MNRGSQTIGEVIPVSLIGLLMVAFTAVWLGIYNWLNTIIWSNNFVESHRFMIPVGVLFFSLLIGLCQKYLRAPNMIHGGGLVDALSGNKKDTASSFPVTIVTSLLSLLSGACIGPEGSIGLLVSDILAWLKKKAMIVDQNFPRFLSVGLAAAYNGIIGNPLFTGVLITELKETRTLQNVTWNLLGGVIGFTFFTLLQLNDFAKYLPFTPITTLKLEYFIYAILLGIIGAAVAVFVGVSMHVFEKLLKKIFVNRGFLRIMFAGSILAFIGYFFPELMFAGETQIFPIVHNPASYGVLLLLFFAVLKILLMALSFKSGFIGGPTFPILFSCTMIGLALSLLFPGIPLSILILCIEVGAITLALKAPLTSILLVTVVGTANLNTVALLVLSAIVAIGVGTIIEDMKKTKRNVKR